MQINLLKLQEQMAKVKTRGSASSSRGSSDGTGAGRWRSARVDRGGLRGYSESIRKGSRNREGRAAGRENVSLFSSDCIMLWSFSLLVSHTHIVSTCGYTP